MNILKTKELTADQHEQINALWNEEYPLKLANRFPILLDGASDHNHYIIEDSNKQVLGWAVDFEKEGEVRFSIIVAGIAKGKGIGGLLIDKLKSEHKVFYGWVIDHNDDDRACGNKYRTPMPFYLKHGFGIMEDQRIDNEMISAVKVKWQG